MSGSHSTHMDDKPSFSLVGTESQRGYHAPEWTSHSPVYQAYHGTSTVLPELQGSVFSPNNWPAGTSIQTPRSETTAHFVSSTPLPLTTLRGSPIPSHGSDGSPPHFGYSTSSGISRLISDYHPQTVAMPTLAEYAEHGGGLIDAHTCHYGPSSVLVRDNRMVEYPLDIPSPVIAMPVVSPTNLGAGASGYVDPVPPSDQTLLWSSRHPIATYQHSLPLDYTLSPTSSGNFDTGSYHLPSSPPSLGIHSPVAPSSEMSDQFQSQQTTTTSLDQPYTFIVPSGAVEFPPFSDARELPFFQCCWEDCGLWITCDKEAVKDHLTRVHSVVFREQTDDSTRCKWVDCSSSPKRSGLVRHFLTHLYLRWLCSVCQRGYTRTDSLGSHIRKEPRCRLAQATSYPSAVAYSARINGDDTVTLTKILQP